MSNIYEALELAERERATTNGPNLQVVPGTKGAQAGSISNSADKTGNKVMHPVSLDMEEEMVCLDQNIDLLLPDTPKKSILFVGPQGGEGVSTIVREFANMAVSRYEKRALIMDTAHHNPSQHIYYNLKSEFGWKEAMGNGKPAESACHEAGNNRLFLSPISMQPVLPPQIRNHAAAASFLGELKQKFDLLLIDASPVDISPDSISIARHTDGVVLVIEAERTRWQVIEHLRNKVVRNGGKVLGIILNKRKYHIPESIYRRLG
jgi:Mrp family chromosome partitioning ATPase